MSEDLFDDGKSGVSIFVHQDYSEFIAGGHDFYDRNAIPSQRLEDKAVNSAK